MKVEEIIQAISNGTIEGAENMEICFVAQEVNKGGEGSKISGNFVGTKNKLSIMFAGLMLEHPDFREIIFDALDKIAYIAANASGLGKTETSEETDE